MSEPCRVITEEQYKDYLRSKEQLNDAIKIVNMYWEEESNQESREFLEKWGYGHD